MKPPIGDYAQVTGRPHSQIEQQFGIEGQPRLRPDAYECDESSAMRDNKRRDRPKSSGRTGPELRVVGIDCNPGPDAENRLRRLFAILVKLAARDDRRPPQTDGSPDSGSEAES